MPRFPRRLRRVEPLVLAAVLAVAALAGCASSVSDAESSGPGSAAATHTAASPVAGGSAGSTVLAVIGDAGELDDDTMVVAELVKASGASTVLTVGDNEYATEGRTVEYDQRFVDEPSSVCERSGQLGLRTLIVPLDLDASFRIACDD